MNSRKAGAAMGISLIALVLAILPASGASAPTQLTGRTTFAGYFSQSGFVFSPADWNYCDATATISQMEGQTLVLAVGECSGYRQCTWEFKITKGGVVKGGPVACTPAFETGSLVSDVQLHTGCKVNGTFPVYHGTWDGNTLSVASHFHGRCDGGTYWGEAWFWDEWEGIPGVNDPEGYLDDGVTWDDGPAHVTFGLDLAFSE